MATSLFSKERYMKRILIVSFSFMLIILATSLLGQVSSNAPSPQPQPQKEQSFLEVSKIPEGKAIVYIYRAPNEKGEEAFAVPTVFSKSGPIGILPGAGYYACVVDPGAVKFWFVCDISKDIVVEAVAGKAYYIKVTPAFAPTIVELIDLRIEIIPAEKAKTDAEILYCKPLK
jgi:hypothetical protein